MAVPIQPTPTLTAGNPDLLHEASYLMSSHRNYDIAPSGDRFLRVKQGADLDTDDPFAGLGQIVVVQNWFEELQARVPTER